ncbi:MAG: SOS response-associated peptidase [Methanomassiliicoccales archaeon]|nr:MAG: SOS response-associated peptidase [Methanomassiliicoccales archaeon]
MCGRFVIAFTEGFHARFKVPVDEIEVKVRYNVAPSQFVPIVISEGSNKLEMMRWGLIPSWTKEEGTGLKLINARSETVNEKKMFKRLMERNRCIVPSTGFFEWMRTDSGKYPYYIHRKDNKFMAYAGLYDRWKTPAGEVISSFTILTTVANDLMRPIHDRMPVILCKEDEDLWLTKADLDEYDLRRMFAPYGQEDLEAYQVAKLVRNPALDIPELIMPVDKQTRTVQMRF